MAQPQVHPAFQTWTRLRPAASSPDAIESLKPEGRHSIVYRLRGAGPAAGNVIAKRSGMHNISVERAVYQQVLSHVPVSTPELYGFVEDEDPGYGWLFFEDVGDSPYAAELAEHRALAGEWLGLMHSTAASISAAASLPDRGAAYYFERICAARETLVRSLPNPALAGDYGSIIKALIAQCDTLLPHWGAITVICERTPKTVVHGDFSFKNIRVRAGGNRPALVVFDWESAGWNVSAPDLPWIDADVYWSVVQREWSHVGIEDIELLANIGKVFRCTAAIPGEGASLGSEWVDRSMRKILYYQQEIATAIQAFGWAS
jgi:aminoglycoside phosphotransferase (APT) family kinase protein